MPGLTRRDFFTGLALGIPAALLPPGIAGQGTRPQRDASLALPAFPPPAHTLDLSPARWIWYPSERCLPNTFVQFRRVLTIDAPIRKVTGWIAADSRYLLQVNGERVQWGPAPSDPRWMEVDPVDLTPHLHAGENVLGTTVLFFGHGDGTWPVGKPGFICRLAIEYADGSTALVATDATWQCRIARSWTPGHYKRWYVRSLQEEYDARLATPGWEKSGFTPDDSWTAAMPLPDSSAAAPPIASAYREYAYDLRASREACGLRPRSIPLLRETLVPAARLAESLFVTWHRPPEEYFECLTPGAFSVDRRPAATAAEGGPWTVPLEPGRGAVLTFSMSEEAVGWPYFTIDAPAGTVIELMVQEHHEPGGAALLNTHYHSWTRFICTEGVNRFETFDYEAVQWLQLHIRHTGGTATVSQVGIRRRNFAWSHEPKAVTDDPVINTLLRASVNTVCNSIQDLAVDGMGRERQQYSGDGSHQLHAVYLAFGETAPPARFLTTYCRGITEEGYFLDCWPAYDRLARLWERQLQSSYWGPLVDHGIGFVFDCWHHYLYTGDRATIEEVFPRLLKFYTYLRSLRRDDGLLPVEGLGVPSVYIDHLAYARQGHKKCVFNLYAVAMLEHALAPLCRVFGEEAWERDARRVAGELLGRTREEFWDDGEGIYVVNRPWRDREKERRYCDRSLALGILYNLCPEGRTDAALAMLAEAPPAMGFSYPANACWRLWALAKGGQPEVILHDFRTRWSAMESVGRNNTLQEFWKERPDAGSVMSHSCPVPLYLLYMGIAGIQPLAPGFERCLIRPQPADLTMLSVTAPTVRGDIVVATSGGRGERHLTVTMPSGCTGELAVNSKEILPLAPWPSPEESGLRRYLLPAGTTADVTLRYT